MTSESWEPTVFQYGQRLWQYDFDPISQAMDKKLVITIAPTGDFIMKEQNPYQPYTPAEVAEHVIESYKAGASVFHVHVRDEKGIMQGANIPMIMEALDSVLDECPDMILSHSGHARAGLRGDAAARALADPLLEAGIKSGRRYIHTVVVMTMPHDIQYIDETTLKETVQYFQNNNIVPEFQIECYRALYNAITWLIQPGILKKPYVINLLSGIHGPTYVGPTHPDPWGQIYLMTMLNGFKQMIPTDCVFGATIGGHNWLPLTVQAIMLGFDCVRIGMEDTLWMYPHKEDKIKSCADVVKKVATIARELGREIATPTEAREILGLNH